MTMEKGNEQQMMNEEYGKEFGGCLWLFIACLFGLATLGCVILFT